MKKRSTRTLSTVLYDELDNLIEGKSTPQNANAKVKLVNSIVSVKRLEMDAARFISSSRRNVKEDIEEIEV